MIRPCGPVPATADKSIPLSRAKRRASGDTNMREPASGAGVLPGAAAPPKIGGRWKLDDAAAVAMPPDADAVALAAIGAGAEAAGAGVEAGLAAGAAPAFSPSTSNVAMGVLTLTFSVPAAIRI